MQFTFKPSLQCKFHPSTPKIQFHLQALSWAGCVFPPQFCDIKNLANCPKCKEMFFKFENPKKTSIFGGKKTILLGNSEIGTFGKIWESGTVCNKQPTRAATTTTIAYSFKIFNSNLESRSWCKIKIMARSCGLHLSLL